MLNIGSSEHCAAAIRFAANMRRIPAIGWASRIAAFPPHHGKHWRAFLAAKRIAKRIKSIST